MPALCRTGPLRLLTLFAAATSIALAASAPPAQAERWAFSFGNDVINDGNVCTTDCQHARSGSGSAQLGYGVGATVVGNDVFVPDLLDNRVSVYDAPTGLFLRAFGAGVGPNFASVCTTECGVGAVLGCVEGTTTEDCLAAGAFTYQGNSIGQPIASSASGGQLFVTESTGRVSVWDIATSKFVHAFGRGVGGPGVDNCTTSCQLPACCPAGSAAGVLSQPGGVAIVGTEAFVADSGHSRVLVFDSATGNYLRGFGKGVGPGGTDTCTTTCQQGSTGDGPGQFGAGGPGNMVYAGGDLFVVDASNHRVLVFDPATGALRRAMGGTPGTAAGLLDSPFGLAIAGSELFVGDIDNHRTSVFNAATGAFVRALGKDVGGPGTWVCTTSCVAGAIGDPATGVDPSAGVQFTPGGISVAGGRLYIADVSLARLTVLDATTGLPVYAAGFDIRRGDGNGFERCRITCQAGTIGVGSGHLGAPAGMAVSGSELFVGEATNRVSVFDTATGKFIRAFGTGVGGAGVDTCTTSCTFGTASEDGAGSPRGAIAVTISGGKAFVSEQEIDRVSVFSATTGAFIRAFGKDVGGNGVDTCAPAASCRAGTEGDGAGELDSPNGLGVIGDEVFVAEGQNRRISVFSATTGEFVRAFGKNVGGSGVDVCAVATSCHIGSQGPGAGFINDPEGLAVAGNEVFVADVKNSRVAVFSSSGTFLRAYGKDVGGPGVNTCSDPCFRGSSGGTYGGGLFNPITVAVSAGQLYVGDTGTLRVSVFDAANGAFLRAFGRDVGGPGVDTCTSTCGLGGGGALNQVRLTDVARSMFVPFGVAVSGSTVFVSDAAYAWVSVWSNSPDVTAPETTVSSGPSAPTNDNTPTFGFSSEAGAVFECRIDSGSWEDCTPTLTTSTLPDGPHTFQVRALDAAFNVDTTPASRSFSVDTTPPETTITGVTGPVGGKLTFAFSSSETGSTFKCKLDNGAFASCTSAFTTGVLSSGSHTFQVFATDALGNADQTPASVTVAPPTLTAAATSSPNYVLRATLSFNGSPLPGQSITFKAGNVTLCTATTNTQGVAQCSPGAENKPAIGAINNARGYTATFAATGSYLGATANGTLGGGGGKG